jgi:hypothetical protein
MVNCSVTGNNIYGSPYGAAVIQANAKLEADGNSEVRLEGCTFSDNTPPTLPTLLADNRNGGRNRGIVHSDNSAQIVCIYEGKKQNQPVPPCLNEPPRSLELAGERFLTAQGLQELGGVRLLGLLFCAALLCRWLEICQALNFVQDECSG